MKYIVLLQGYYTLVDDDDYEWLMQWKDEWKANIREDGRVYAYRWTYPNQTDTNIWMHREIVKAVDPELVDHIDGDTLNNSKANLRKCNSEQNSYNRKLNVNSKSGYKGVTWHSKMKKWRAAISCTRLYGSIPVSLGLYNSKIDAARAYDRAAIAAFGEFARTNFPR